MQSLLCPSFEEGRALLISSLGEKEPNEFCLARREMCHFRTCWVPVPLPLKNWQCLTVSCHSLSGHRINQLHPFCHALCVGVGAGGHGLSHMQLHSKHKEAADFLAVSTEEYNFFFAISKPAFKMALVGTRNQYPLT